MNLYVNTVTLSSNLLYIKETCIGQLLRRNESGFLMSANRQNVSVILQIKNAKAEKPKLWTVAKEGEGVTGKVECSNILIFVNFHEMLIYTFSFIFKFPTYEEP